jgi:hypothetical protein
MWRWSNVPNRSALTRSSGLYHHVTIRLSSPAMTMLATPTMATFTASQRVREVLCVHASR